MNQIKGIERKKCDRKDTESHLKERQKRFLSKIGLWIKRAVKKLKYEDGYQV